MNKPLLHVRIMDEHLTEDEMDNITAHIQDALDEWDVDAEAFVTHKMMSIGEVPALDAYADEIADRVVARMEELN